MLGLSTLLLGCLLAPARASDVGTQVTLAGRPLAGPLIKRSYGPTETQVSDWIAEAFDTVLFQGLCDDPGAVFDAARQDATGQWTPWAAAQVKRFPGDRYWAKVSFAKVAPGRVKLRASTSAAGNSLEVYSIDAFRASDREKRARGRSLPPPGQSPERAPLPGPDVILRAEWGAKPPKEPFSPLAPYRFTQHHTAGKLPNGLQESLAEMRFIQDFHQNGRGWNDIGYHFLIDPEGRVFQGRPIDAQGAHVLGGNEGNVGISLMGSYHSPYWHQMTPEQSASIKRLGVWLRDRFSVSPDSYRGHRDYRSTTCPGDAVYKHLPDIKEAIRSVPAPIQAAVRALRLDRFPEALRRAWR